MSDLTVIFLTVNKLPQGWARWHLRTLKKAIGDAEVISVSRLPMDFGTNLIQEEGQSHSNIYKQMLRAAKIATTPFVAVAEDDTLYQREHFLYRPSTEKVFAYNMARWSLYTWGEPMYSFKERICNCSLIAPRELLIEALEERFAKWPEIPHHLGGELGFAKVESRLGVTIRSIEQFYSITSIIQFSHDYGTPGFSRLPEEGLKMTEDYIERLHRKRHGFIRAYEIPYWGRAEEVVRRFR